MRTLIALFILAAALPAAAQDHPDVVYQNALLARSLSPADKTFCDGKAGPEKSVASDACRVTRLFLADIAAGKEKGFPPLTDIKFTLTKEEKGKILDRI